MHQVRIARKNNMTQSYVRTLEFLMLCRVMDSKTLNHLFKTNVERYRFLDRAIKNGHVRKTEVKETKNKKRKCKTYYQITTEGLYAIAQKNNEVNEILEVCERLVVMNSYEQRKQNKARIANESKALLLAYKTGAEIPIENFTTGGEKSRVENESYDDDEEWSNGDREEPPTLQKIISETLTEKSELFLQTFGDKGKRTGSPYVYSSSRLVKAQLQEEFTRQKAEDVKSGRYYGFLETASKTCMVYVASKFTMSWSEWATRKEAAAYRMWGKTNSVTPLEVQMERGSSAVLVVDNAQEFGYQYNSYSMENKDEPFGGSFQHLYIVPNDPVGVAFLRWIMTIDDDEVIESVTEMAIRSGLYSKNNMHSLRYFQLRDGNGNETAIALTFNAKELSTIRSCALKPENAGKVFQLLCFEWQKDYYTRIFPENVIYGTFQTEAFY